MATKKNPADATLRNVRASRSRDAVMRERLSRLTRRVVALEQQVRRLGAKDGRR